MDPRYYTGRITFEYISLISVKKLKTFNALVLELDFGSVLGSKNPIITERRVSRREAEQFAVNNGDPRFFGSLLAAKKKEKKS